MSRREYASRILTELCSDLGLPAAEMQPDGLLTLAFDDIRVTFRHVTTPLETLVLLVDLGELPADAGQAAAMLLELNLVTWGRNNLTIGLGADGRQVLGRNILPLITLDRTGLREVLEAMLESTVPIREAVANFTRAARPRTGDEAARQRPAPFPRGPGTLPV
ncbi:MAG: CesT family type III secretion system chaperone [Chromatiaceae bacterium]|nr:CesT family type III secretion system chaperone [Chromatiaceae bacterium]MCP5315868.1 CesT family type III secretion system chaperone [Chromatiaceae bacterium]